jgi:hypothetical protein
MPITIVPTRAKPGIFTSAVHTGVAAAAYVLGMAGVSRTDHPFPTEQVGTIKPPIRPESRITAFSHPGVI